MTQNAAIFEHLEPAGFWQHFAAITRIPRPSKSEQKMADYVIAWANAHKFETRRDAAGNLLVHIPATLGRESAEPIILQGHLDMVCERQQNSSYDALAGNILIIRDGDWLIAPETTLGADNGVAIAAMLWLAEQKSLNHGPLDLLMTVEEETGQQGAANLDPALLRAKTLINLDSEEVHVLCVGCAGGIDTRFTWSAPKKNPPAGWQPTTLHLTGLRGGHSGGDIDKPRLNAIKALTRILQSATTPFFLATIDGGSRRNAIPRDASATIFHPADQTDQIRAAFTRATQQLAEQFRGHEDALSLTLESPAAVTAKILPETFTCLLLDFLRALPSGVLSMSPDFPGMVQASTNLALIKTTADQIEITSLSRSSDALALRDALDSLQSIARLARATAAESDGYPGWKPNLNSPLLHKTAHVYQHLFNAPPEIAVVHGGLECGLFASKANLDMISIGPTILGPHAPGEKLSIPSVQKFTRLLPALLDSLSK